MAPVQKAAVTLEDLAKLHFGTCGDDEESTPGAAAEADAQETGPSSHAVGRLHNDQPPTPPSCFYKLMATPSLLLEVASNLARSSL